MMLTFFESEFGGYAIVLCHLAGGIQFYDQDDQIEGEQDPGYRFGW